MTKKLEKKIVCETEEWVNSGFDLENIKNQEIKQEVKKTLVDCFGLLKSLQIEGDIEYDKNGFY